MKWYIRAFSIAGWMPFLGVPDLISQYYVYEKESQFPSCNYIIPFEIWYNKAEQFTENEENGENDGDYSMV